MSKTLHPEKPVLLVDDESNFLLSMAVTLRSGGINNVIQCNDSRKVIDIIDREGVSVVLLDMNMAYRSGLEVLQDIALAFPELPVVIITAIDDVKTAVNCMKMGAFDYIVKPVDRDRILTVLEKTLEFTQVKHENNRLKECIFSNEIKKPDTFSHIVTDSEKMISIFKYIEAISGTDHPVLITGETGTGKELIAQALYNQSGKKGSFVAVNVAGLDDTHFSDTLFGHLRGAFTGADRERKGLIESAEGGMIFLDEIGDLHPDSQVKLLRLLQEKLYYPLGSDKPKKVKARIILATHRNLDQMLKEGGFRRDLYYRLKTHHIQIPSLRERMEDVPLLLDHFLEKSAESMGKKKPTPPRELYSLLNTYPFPGNVRELESMVIDAVGRHSSGVLSTSSFREKIFSSNGEGNESGGSGTMEGFNFPEKLPTLKEFESMLIDEAYKRAKGNQTIAARLLDISRKAFNNRLMRNLTGDG